MKLTISWDLKLYVVYPRAGWRKIMGNKKQASESGREDDLETETPLCSLEAKQFNAPGFSTVVSVVNV